AVLRAPWCGLRWQDLEALCGAAPDRPIAELLQDDDALERVSGDARRRLRRVHAVLCDALRRRTSMPFARWIEHTWVRLGGEACLDSPDERRFAEHFFALLEQAAWRGDLADPAALETVFMRPQAPPAPMGEGAVEIMTIHKAKGLEFDTVILFGLGREPRREDSRALYWMERLAGDGSRDLLMAPLPEQGRDERLARFIRGADDARERAERVRLMYVAATRARRRLHLICRLDPSADEPAARTLLAPIWRGVEPSFAALAGDDTVAEPTAEIAVQSVLKRLVRPADEHAEGDGAEALPDLIERPEFEWASQPAVHVGTLVHRYLQRFAVGGLDGWNVQRVRASTDAFRRELLLLGLDPGDAEEGAHRVARALEGVLEDPDGRWILGPRREARSELRLTLRSGDRLEHVRLDRTFVDDGDTRWIVDYKTGVHEGGELDAFLDSEVERYRPQLQRYAAAIASLDTRPIRVGLYFPLLKSLRSWEPP
ncbi:MAG: PD-(D/E)XK nuclease family protein, partial [Gammaproteobacteria bacterium]|nr:PD-(D/E)XK nuclease family protein [Gammaproteobacteria bacterium]